MNHITARC